MSRSSGSCDSLHEIVRRLLKELGRPEVGGDGGDDNGGGDDEDEDDDNDDDGN
jgi:hypothetical protein